MSVKILRIYKSDTGIWRIEIERYGVVRWSSLDTRDEAEAKRKREHYEGALTEAAAQEQKR